MMACANCKQGIVVSDLPLACVGKCGSVFHYKCTNITKPMAKLITDNVNVQYKCDDCLSSQCCDEQNVLISDVKKIEEEMKKLSSLSDSVTDMRDQITAQIDIALKTGMDVLRQNLNETFEKLISEKWNALTRSVFEFNANRNIAPMNNQNSSFRAVQSESDQTPRSKKRKFSNRNNDDNVFQSNVNFADLFKGSNGGVSNSNGNGNSNGNFGISNQSNSNKPKNRNTRPVIVIKPKESKQACDDTRKYLKTQLDPKTDTISNFRNGKDGSIIAECPIGSNLNAVKNNIESKLGENYSAVVPTPPVPRLKIVGMTDQYSDEIFIDYLRSQNEDIEIKDVKVLRMYENPRFTYNKFNVVIEVDVDTYKCLLCAKQVNVGYDRCPVVPEVSVLRCFECGEFGHHSNKCQNGARCSRCSQQHKTSECTSTVLKCVNCLKTNKERKMNLDVNHAAFSTNCPIYKRLFDQRKSSLRFNK